MAARTKPRTGAPVDGGAQPARHSAMEPLVPLGGSGVSTGVRDPLLFLSRHELVLALGKFVAVQNTQSQELFFLGQQHQPAQSSAAGLYSALGEVTALALCPKTHIVAVCRAAMRVGDCCVQATVTLYKVSSAPSVGRTEGGSATDIVAVKAVRSSKPRQRGTWLKTLGFDAERFVSTALSPDGKLVCCQSATPAWTLVVWDWGRARQIASIDVHCKVTRARFNVIDMAQLSTSGGNLLRLWTLAEYSLRPFASFKSGDETKLKRVVSYADHVWLPNDCLVALLEDGDVQLIVNAELVQTLRSVHSGMGRLACMTALSNGEGVVVGGSHGLVSVIRVAAKMMKTDEKELHFQRRINVRDAEHILGLGTDPAAAVLLCCTERNYGVYDLSDLCLLRGDDEVVTLNAMASTPLSTRMDHLSAASRRACFAASCQLPGEEYAVNVWNQADAHECYLTHTFEQASAPLSLDLHPHGSELLVSFSAKLQIFLVLQDSVRLGFELAQKQISVVKYSPSGSLFAGVHTANKTVYVYQSCTRAQRAPQLVGVASRDFHAALTQLAWAPHDNSFFVADAAGEVRHCVLRWEAGGEVEELVKVQSVAQVQTPGSSILCMAACRIDRDGHDYIVFAAEKAVAAGASSHGSLLRCWMNGELGHEVLRGRGGHVGERISLDITALTGTGGSPNLLFAGTGLGAVAIFSWKRGKLDHDGRRTIALSSAIRVVDVHTSAVSGLFFVDQTRTLMSNASSGAVLACAVAADPCQTAPEPSETAKHLAGLLEDGTEPMYLELSTGFTSICQADEIGYYDRSKIELARLKAMDVEGELQQLRLENEMLARQGGEQRARFEATVKREVATAHEQAEDAKQRLRFELDARMEGAVCERESRLEALTADARAAQDHYLINTEKLQRECDTLREALVALRMEMAEALKTARDHEDRLAEGYEAKLHTQQRRFEAEKSSLQGELTLANRKLEEVLRQQHQDQAEQVLMLSGSIEVEKRKAVDQQSAAHGKLAALSQEIKMLLSTLAAKDHELQLANSECDRKAQEIDALLHKMQDERRSSEAAAKDRHDALAKYAELKGQFENLQRLDGVHRSQIEILQRHLIPKEQELDKMQQYVGQLHDANQEIVVQANLSDRFREETALKAKKHEREVAAAQRQLDKTRHSIVVLQEELGELVKKSAVQEKNTLVGEIVRIHKRLARQLTALQARDDGSEDVNAELHRQTTFLLKDKQHQRRQLEAAHQEKSKLASALSFQNATLMSEVNVLKKQNKELERQVKRQENQLHRRSVDGRGANNLDVSTTDESSVDARPFLSARPEVFGVAIEIGGDEREEALKGFCNLTARAKPGLVRPKSATAATSKRPSTAGPVPRPSWQQRR